jgi:hypothetical protein
MLFKFKKKKLQRPGIDLALDVNKVSWEEYFAKRREFDSRRR